MTKEKQIAITVVIPTHNRADDLRRCLLALSRQTCQDFEIIIVDNGGLAESRKVFDEFVVRVIPDFTRNVTHLFNVGWRAAAAEVIAFTNDDAEPQEKWLESVLTVFAEYPDAGAVGGPTILPTGSADNQEMLRLHSRSLHSLWYKFPAWVYERFVLEGKYHDIGVLCESGAYSVGGSLAEAARLPHPIPVDLLSITNAAIKKKVLEEVNGLDENFRFTHGDGDLFIRIRKAGYRLIFDPGCVVWHHVNPQGDTRVAFWRGRDQAYFLKKCIRPKSFKGKVGYALNVAFYNSYWIYKTLLSRDCTFLKGISGFFQGLKDYRASVRGGGFDGIAR